MTTEVHAPRARALQWEATAMRSPRTAMKSSPRSLQLEKACAQQRRPNTAKKTKKSKKTPQQQPCWELPGGPVVRTWCFHCWAQVQSLVGELRSCKPCDMAGKKQNQNHALFTSDSEIWAGHGRMAHLYSTWCWLGQLDKGWTIQDGFTHMAGASTGVAGTAWWMSGLSLSL